MDPSEEAEGSNDEDIYENLPEFSYGGKVDELEKSNEALRSQLFLLESKLRELKNANNTLTKKERALSRNISVLFATTSAEIEHKNRMIQDLRKERDSLIFRRVRHTTTYETQTTFVPPVAELNYVAAERNHSVVPVQPVTSVVSDSRRSPRNIKHTHAEQSLNDNISQSKSPKGTMKIPNQRKESKTHGRMDKNSTKNSFCAVKEVTHKGTVEKPWSIQKKNGMSQVTAEELMTTALSQDVTPTVEGMSQSGTISEAQATSSTPKLQSESILRNLLKKGLGMSPFKMDSQAGFRIPKVSGQVELSNVPKESGVLGKSYEQQQNPTDIDNSVKSESSVDISVPSVTDCTGGKRCRTFIRSISISEDESSSSSSESKSETSSSDEEEKQDSQQKYGLKVSQTGKFVSSPKTEGQVYVSKNAKRTCQVVDYKSIEKIKIVGGSPKKLILSPVKCRLKVTAVVEKPARPKHSRDLPSVPASRGEKSSLSDNRQARDTARESNINKHSKSNYQEYKRHSPSPRRYRTSHRKQSQSPPKQRSPSPPQRQSPSPSRSRSSSFSRHSQSPRQQSPSPIRRRSPSPIRRHSPSPSRRHSPSPLRKCNPPSPRRHSPSLTRSHSPSSIRQHSPSPRKHSLSSSRKDSMSPVRRPSTSPPRRHSTSPIRRHSPSPLRQHSQSPMGGHSPSSSRHSSHSLSPFLRLNPSPMKGYSPSPSRRQSPSPSRRRSPSPSRRRSPSPTRRRNPSPSKRGPSPSRRSISPPRKFSPSPIRRHRGRRRDVYLPHSLPRKVHRDLRDYIRRKEGECQRASKRTRPPSPMDHHGKRMRLKEPERRGPPPNHKRHFVHQVERVEGRTPPLRHELDNGRKKRQNGHRHQSEKSSKRSPVVYKKQAKNNRNERNYDSDTSDHGKARASHTNINKGPVTSRMRIIRASISPENSPINKKEKYYRADSGNEMPNRNKVSRTKIQILDRESSSDAEQTKPTKMVPYNPEATRSPSHSLEEGEISDSC